MAYIQRDQSSKIIGVFANKQPGYAEEELADSNAEIVAVLTPPAPTLAQQLGPTDHEMARAGEDLFATLIANGTITKADVPAIVVERINARRVLRGQIAL